MRTQSDLASRGVDVEASRAQAIDALATMIDYAIVEGAELRMPMLVYLLRLAALELRSHVPTGPPDERDGG